MNPDQPDKTLQLQNETSPSWETIRRPQLRFWYVRWSKPIQVNIYLYVAHYPNTAWGEHAAKQHAQLLNDHHLPPSEFR